MPSCRQFSKVTEQTRLSLRILPVSTVREVQASSFYKTHGRLHKCACTQIWIAVEYPNPDPTCLNKIPRVCVKRSAKC